MTWDDVLESYANLGWRGRGVGSSPESRVIGKSKTYHGGTETRRRTGAGDLVIVVIEKQFYLSG